MKSLKYITLGCLLVLGSTSCKKYLDINTDPNNPNNQSVLVQNRLPWIEHYYMYSSGITNFRTSCQREFFMLSLLLKIRLAQHGNVLTPIRQLPIKLGL